MENELSHEELIINIPLKKEEDVLGAWEQAFLAREGEIIDHAQITKLLEEMSGTDASKETPTAPIPGGFSCGEDPEAFYIVYKKLCGEEPAKRALEHELEHYKVYRKYGIPTNFAVVVSKLPNGKYFTIPLVSPQFPSDMPSKKRLEISYEANNAVTVKSKRDKKMMEQYKEE